MLARSRRRSRFGKRTLFDLTQVEELASLGRILRLFEDATQQLAQRSLIVGATARDLILHHAHGLRITRATADLDIAVAVESWDAFHRLVQRLIDQGAQRDPHMVHRFFIDDWRMDVVPFGNIEHDGIIVWPDTESKMSVVGFDEASHHALEFLLPGRIRAFVTSPPALLMLKLIAWDDRHLVMPRHDAADIRTLIDSYAESWNEDRLYTEADDLLRRFGYDNGLAGAALIGRDSAAIARRATLARMIEIVERETSDETSILATDMSRRIEENLALLRALRIGLQDAALSRL
jgi:predicted nucleotidyltransferase